MVKLIEIEMRRGKVKTKFDQKWRVYSCTCLISVVSFAFPFLLFCFACETLNIMCNIKMLLFKIDQVNIKAKYVANVQRLRVSRVVYSFSFALARKVHIKRWWNFENWKYKKFSSSSMHSNSIHFSRTSPLLCCEQLFHVQNAVTQ